jgi:hypothetical protein
VSPLITKRTASLESKKEAWGKRIASNPVGGMIRVGSTAAKDYAEGNDSLGMVGRGECRSFEPDSHLVAPFVAAFVGPPDPFILTAIRLACPA